VLPHVVESPQFHFGANQWEEHTELGTVHALEEPAENVIVIEEVATLWQLVCIKRPL